MKTWKDAIAVVTGGGSGIGAALSRAMSERGAKVVVADVNGESAVRIAEECGANASWKRLDVRSFPAVRRAIEEVVSEHGRLDYLFNNAGVGVAGEAHEIPIEAWNWIIDINLRGVVHGVAAAYPLMVKQGSGHIINTASLSGLGPAPLLTPYAMTKHAVVGLSTSLRIEGAARGVKVSVLCPAAIETPLLDTKELPSIPQVPWFPDIRRYLTKLAGPAYPVESCAAETLRAVERNKAIIVLPGRARLVWRLMRLFPWLTEKVTGSAVAAERAQRSSTLTEVAPRIESE